MIYHCTLDITMIKFQRNYMDKFEIRTNGKSISKCFSKKSMTMKVKLDLAIKYKDEILENLRKNQQLSSKDE